MCRVVCTLLVMAGLVGAMPVPSFAASNLECPEVGPGALPDLLADSQIKLLVTGNSVELTNEIGDLINRLQIQNPNISYAELTNVLIAAYCPVVANAPGVAASEKWRRMRQFDAILQQQVAASITAPGTLIIANVPLPPAVYRELRSQAASAGQTPTQLMGAILTRAAGK
jgi:hypothetical protein